MRRPHLATLVSAGVVLSLVAVAPSWAHAPSERVGDFWGGFLHPLTTLGHALPLLALGLLAGQQGRAGARRMLLVLPVAVVIGTAIAVTAPAPDSVVLGNRLSFVALGALVAGAWSLPVAVPVVLATVFGLSHGWENASELPVDRTLVFGAGSVVAAVFLLSLAAAAVVSIPTGWPRIAVRVVGSWITAIGVMVLALG